MAKETTPEERSEAISWPHQSTELNQHANDRGAKPRRSLRERFDAMTMPDLGRNCLLWTGALFRNGYGQINVNGKTVGAHRVSYVLHHGLSLDSIAGYCVCHRCDVRDCVEPTHLFLGTRATNNRDRDRKGRHVACPGEKNGFSKLTHEQAAGALAAMLGGESQASVARRLKIHESTAHYILKGKLWKHLPR